MLVLVFLVVPTLIVVPMSFSGSQYLEFPPRQWSLRWYADYFGSPEWMQATATSLKAGAADGAVARRRSASWRPTDCSSRGCAGRRLAIRVLLTPMIVPVILVGIGVFYAYVRLKLVNTLIGLVLAHSVLAMPLVSLVVTSALKSYDMNQEMVARSLGASRPRAFLLVTLPQIRLRGDQRRVARLPHLVRRGGRGAVRLGRRQLDADAQHVQRAARPDRPDHRGDLDDDDPRHLGAARAGANAWPAGGLSSSAPRLRSDQLASAATAHHSTLASALPRARHVRAEG